jgi:hypothetical protein
MYWMLLPLDPNASRHTEDHRVPPSGSLRDLFHDCWSAVLRLLTYTAPSASYGAHRPENSLRRTKYLELRAKYLARSRRTRQ